MTWEKMLKEEFSGPPQEFHSKYGEIIDVIELTDSKMALKNINRLIGKLQEKPEFAEVYIKHIQEILDDLDKKFTEAAKYVRRKDERFLHLERVKRDE